jgi:hypothetical protein
MEVSGQLHSPTALPPGKEPPVPIGKASGWAPEAVWTQWIIEKSLASVGNSTLSVQPVACRRTEQYCRPHATEFFLSL